MIWLCHALLCLSNLSVKRIESISSCSTSSAHNIIISLPLDSIAEFFEMFSHERRETKTTTVANVSTKIV